MGKMMAIAKEEERLIGERLREKAVMKQRDKRKNNAHAGRERGKGKCRQRPKELWWG